jgi:cytidylate kinase
MAVITISRQHGSGGHEVTRLICERLGYRYFDKELMVQLGAQIGLKPDQVVDLPEDKHHVQNLVERLFANAPNPLGDPGEWVLQAKLDAQQELSVQAFQSLIRAAHEHDNVVVMGRGGQMALHDTPDVLHVRLVAPLELRIQRVQENAGLTADAARARVSQRDQASATADLIIKALDCLPEPAEPAHRAQRRKEYPDAKHTLGAIARPLFSCRPGPAPNRARAVRVSQRPTDRQPARPRTARAAGRPDRALGHADRAVHHPRPLRLSHALQPGRCAGRSRHRQPGRRAGRGRPPPDLAALRR